MRGGPSTHSHGQTAQKNPYVYNRLTNMSSNLKQRFFFKHSSNLGWSIFASNIFVYHSQGSW
jgi:hypothetical protein